MGANQDAAAVSPSTSFFLLQWKWPCCNVAMLAVRRKKETNCIVAEMDKKLICHNLYFFPDHYSPYFTPTARLRGRPTPALLLQQQQQQLHPLLVDDYSLGRQQQQQQQHSYSRLRHVRQQQQQQLNRSNNNPASSGGSTSDDNYSTVYQQQQQQQQQLPYHPAAAATGRFQPYTVQNQVKIIKVCDETFPQKLLYPSERGPLLPHHGSPPHPPPEQLLLHRLLRRIRVRVKLLLVPVQEEEEEEGRGRREREGTAGVLTLKIQAKYHTCPFHYSKLGTRFEAVFYSLGLKTRIFFPNLLRRNPFLPLQGAPRYSATMLRQQPPPEMHQSTTSSNPMMMLDNLRAVTSTTNEGSGRMRTLDRRPQRPMVATLDRRREGPNGAGTRRKTTTVSLITCGKKMVHCKMERKRCAYVKAKKCDPQMFKNAYV